MTTVHIDKSLKTESLRKQANTHFNGERKRLRSDWFSLKKINWWHKRTCFEICSCFSACLTRNMDWIFFSWKRNELSLRHKFWGISLQVQRLGWIKGKKMRLEEGKWVDYTSQSEKYLHAYLFWSIFVSFTLLDFNFEWNTLTLLSWSTLFHFQTLLFIANIFI